MGPHSDKQTPFPSIREESFGSLLLIRLAEALSEAFARRTPLVENVHTFTGREEGASELTLAFPRGDESIVSFIRTFLHPLRGRRRWVLS